jgi:hypothetical protein
METLIARNIEASNGVANVIPGVLIPSWVSNRITDMFVVTVTRLSSCPCLHCNLGDALAGPGGFFGRSINSACRASAATVTFLTSAAGRPLFDPSLPRLS